MIQEDILRMAREAGFEVGEREHGQSVFNPHTVDECCLNAELERFATIVAAAQREKVAHWMRSMGYATGHGDAIEDLLDHLGTQIAEGLLMEREACAKVCDVIDDGRKDLSADCAAAIRARGNK
jgi:hypothetical protein